MLKNSWKLWIIINALCRGFLVYLSAMRWFLKIASSLSLSSSINVVIELTTSKRCKKNPLSVVLVMVERFKQRRQWLEFSRREYILQVVSGVTRCNRTGCEREAMFKKSITLIFQTTQLLYHWTLGKKSWKSTLDFVQQTRCLQSVCLNDSDCETSAPVTVIMSSGVFFF